MSNGFDPKILAQFVGDIDRLEAEIESRKGSYMAWCKSQRELISETIDRANDAGIPRKDLKAVLKARRLSARIEKLREDLEEAGDVDTFDLIVEALGDLAGTPLGAFATRDSAASEARRSEKAAANADALNAAADTGPADNGASNLVNLSRLN